MSYNFYNGFAPSRALFERQRADGCRTNMATCCFELPSRLFDPRFALTECGPNSFKQVLARMLNITKVQKRNRSLSTTGEESADPRDNSTNSMRKLSTEKRQYRNDRKHYKLQQERAIPIQSPRRSPGKHTEYTISIHLDKHHQDGDTRR